MEPNDIPPRVFFSSQTHCCRRRSLNPIPTSAKKKKDRRLSLSFSTVRKPRRPELGGKKRRVCPLSRRVATVFGAVKILRLPLVKVTEQQEGSCGLIPNTGRSLISPPFRPSVRPSFALTALPPPPVARFASLPSSQRSQTSSSTAARDSRWRRLSPRRQPARRRRAGFWETGSKLAG